jgi:pimeloyl-ACP methyl ester carboxylesterase
MGGAVGLLRACADDRIHALVSLAAVTHAEEFVRRMFSDLPFGQPMLDKPQCPYGQALEADLVGLGSLAERAVEVAVPWLVVHGSADDVVPLQHSLDLHAAAPQRSSLVVLEGADHSFDGDGLGRMIDSAAPWLLEQLGP